MSGRDSFEQILAALHDGALDPAGWTVAAGLLDDALGVHGSTLACGDGKSEEDFRLYFMWTCVHGERRLDLERLWLEAYLLADQSVTRNRNLPYNRATHITDLYTAEELKTSESYHVLRTLGHAGNAINVRLAGPGGSRILWQIDDPLDRDGWTSVQLKRVRQLNPHIRQFVHVRQALAGAGALGATLTRLLDVAGLGIVQLDARGRIVAANDRALSVLRGGDTVYDEGGFLFARVQADDDTLQALLARALPPFGDQGEAGSLTMKRPAPLPPLVLHVNPLRRRDGWFPQWPVAALVLLAEPARGAGIDPDLAAAVLGLTRTESRVAVMLAEGLSVREIAAAMERQESTIRSHVKRIFAKHGLNRQAELVRLVLSLAGAAGLPR